MTETLTREQWLNQAALILIDLVLTPDVVEHQPAPPYRISVAPMASSRVGVCHLREVSEDQHNEIFITAHEDDSVMILSALLHELIHAFDDCQSGHRNFFARVARKAGLEGKLTDTYAGNALSDILSNIVNVLEPIPHAKLNLKPKSKGRNNNKLVCAGCGFQSNLSRKWVDQITNNTYFPTYTHCPACNIQNALQIITP